MPIKNWSRADALAEEVTDESGDIKGWYNETVDELVIRLRDNTYSVEHFSRPEYAKRSVRGRRGRVLFRDSAKRRTDKRVAELLRQHPDGIDVEEVRRAELDAPRDLWEWAHAFGAAYMGTEKIGNRKDSDGDVAIFSGSPRRGEGAYIGLASVHGPDGESYISVGYQSDGYYTVRTEGVRNSRRNAIEIERPKLSFYATGEIVATNDKDQMIRIKPTDKGQTEEAWKEYF